MAKPKLYVGCDPMGADLGSAVADHLRQTRGEQWDIVDRGVGDKYYEKAHEVATEVQASHAAGGADRAVLCCGTGMGMAIIANKQPLVYAAVVSDASQAANSSAINKANVLTLGGKVFPKHEDAFAAVDSWLDTPFISGYEDFKAFLEASMSEIPAMLAIPSSSTLAAALAGAAAAAAAAATSAAAAIQAPAAAAAAAGAAAVPYPAAAWLVNSKDAEKWQPIPGMGHDACVWCKLREDAPLQAGTPGQRVRALVRFPAGAVEPPHHHSSGHDVLVISGYKTVNNHTTGSTQSLGAWSYLYTPAGHIHSVEYHSDTVFYVGFDGPMDLLWAKPARQGVQWAREADLKAAAAPWAPPSL